MTVQHNSTPRPASLAISRCALTGAAVLASLYILCWIPAAIGLAGASHVYMAMFMAGPGGAVGTLLFGVLCSALAGFVVGTLVAFFYNLFAFDRR